MRIRHILNFDGFKPLFCRGADPVSAMVSGVLGVGSSAITASTSAANVDKQLAVQKEENQKNRDWQTEQAEIARQFTTNERLAQQDYQQGAQAQAQRYALQSMAQQAMYNSPVYQRQELKKANVNPQVYFGQQSSFSGSSPQVGSAPSAPSGASSPMPSGVSGLSPVSYQPWQLNVGQLLQNLASAAKLSKETGWLDKDMASRLRALNAQSSLQEMSAVLAGLDKKFKELELPFVQDKAYLEVKKAFSEIELNEESKITQQSQQKLNSAIEKLQGSMQSLTEKQKEKLGIEIQFLPQTLKSIINANTAQAAESHAAAKYHNALALTEDELRDIRIESGRISNSIQDNENNFNIATFQDRVNAIKNRITSTELDIVLKRIEAQDKSAYTTLQRLFYGKGDAKGSDLRKALRLFGEVVTQGFGME